MWRFKLNLVGFVYCATLAAAGSQTYRVYKGYSIGFTSGTNVSNSSIRNGVPAGLLCASFCTRASKCYAATLIKNGLCALQQTCAHVVLRRDPTADTYVISSLVTLDAVPVIDLPLVYQCNVYSQFGSRSLPLPPSMNFPLATSTSANVWPAAATTLNFTTAEWSSLSGSAYLFFNDSVDYSFDVFTTKSSFTISFYYKSMSTSTPQVVFLVSTDYTDASSHCLVGLHDSCGSGYCMYFKYYVKCDGMSTVTATAEVKLQTGFNVWYHVAAVYNAQAGTFNGYVNAALVDSKSISAYGSVTPTQLIIASGSIYSVAVFGISRIYSFAGSIFCFQMFQSALTQKQLNAAYAHCTSGGVLAQ